MSKQRALRRAARLAQAEKARAVRERTLRRRAARRELTRRLRPRLPDRRTGRLYPRRSRAQRAAIVLAAGVALTLIWLLADSLATRIALTALVAVGSPALIVLTLDRRI
jgi:Flp pilus assembly protein TadB